MQKLDYIHLDSFNSVDTNGDSFDTTFNLNQKYKNINKIYLKIVKYQLDFLISVQAIIQMFKINIKWHYL